eukprot:s1486_g12.t1
MVADMGADIGADMVADIGADMVADIGADIGVDMVADIGADMVADMVADMGADMVADIGADIGADMVADMGADIGLASLDNLTSWLFDGDEKAAADHFKQSKGWLCAQSSHSETSSESEMPDGDQGDQEDVPAGTHKHHPLKERPEYLELEAKGLSTRPTGCMLAVHPAGQVHFCF